MSLSTYFYEPFHESFFTFSDSNRLFDAASDSLIPSSQRELSRREQSAPLSGLLRPRMDLYESKDTDEMTATFELPGLRKEDVNIDIHQNRLIVSGHSTISNNHDVESYAVRERRFGKFSRTLPLPAGLKAEDINARMDDGVLTVRFPKSHPDQESKKVAIH